MSCSWNSTTIATQTDALDLLIELRGKRWLSRGQSAPYRRLVPSIDRKRENLSRAQKLSLERQSIDLFRTTARFFAHSGERGALNDDIVALMVLRHYGVPTRLLDWSWSPHVAAYFACENDEVDGEIWSFDEPLYERKGKQQWARWPETTTDRTGDTDKFDAKLTAFTKEEPPDWFVCGFYTGFHRQNAQEGVYTLTARFGRDHAEAIAQLLDDKARCHLYVLPAKLKLQLRTLLRQHHGIWRGSLFPDSAGAAQTAEGAFGN
jgi:hypothetical protein